jgi:hypothetical protein
LNDLDNAEVDHYVAAVHFGALLGYCLGRTAGVGAEHLDGWHGRALALADFDDAYRVLHPDEAWRRFRGAAPAPHEVAEAHPAVDAPPRS